MSTEESSTTTEGDVVPPFSPEFIKMDPDTLVRVQWSTPSSDRMKVDINTEWDPSGDLGDFPRNIDHVVWAHRENGEQWIGVALTNKTYVYIHVIEEEEDYLVVPVGDEEGLDFFKPRALRKTAPVEEFYPDEGLFDLADEM